MNTLILRDGYDRTKNPTRKTYRKMTADEAKQLEYGQRVPFLANDGSARMIKINGRPKTWKRDPSRVEVPVKYGMYEYATEKAQSDGTMETLLVEIEQETLSL
jgi:hypothetical protein